jgi:predicted glutamine amidotransferase
MCIAILNNGKKLTRKELSNCWVSNDDGAGMLYIDNGKLAVFKQPNHDGFNVAGRDFDNFVNEYDRVYTMSKASNNPVLIHFRIATHGLDPAYLHPFLVSDNVGLIHNGIIYGYGTRDVSDTAEFAQELATLPKSMTADVKFLDIDFISNSILDKLDASNSAWPLV